MDAPAACLVTTESAGGPFVRIARWLGRGFEEIGRELDVVLVDGPAGSTRAGRVRHIRLGSGRASRSIPALRRYFHREAPPLALVTPGYLAPFALLAGAGTRVAVVPWEAGFAGREAAELSPKMRLLAPLQRATYRRARGLAAVSGAVARAIGELAGRDDVAVVPNPVDAVEIRALAGAARPAPGFALCAIGKLTRYKGYDVLLDALARTGSQLGDWTLRVIGDGPERGALEAATRRLGLTGRVSFRGLVDNPYPELAACHAFVQPSRFEGFGIGIAEALALRVPVVATYSGGPEEVLDGGRFGLLVPPEDPVALGAAIASLTGADVRDRFATASDDALARFAPAAVARRVVRLADEMAAR